MASQLFGGTFTHVTAAASIPDITPPTFAGITFLDVESRGQIRSGWSAASDASTPIRYEVYIQASTATGLFSVANIVALTPNLQYDIYTLPDGSFLVNGTTYYVGIRAIDAYSNRDSNTVSMNVISTGVLTSIDVYEVEASFSKNTSDQLVVTLWGNKNESLAISPSAVLGTASYQVYDKAGNAVSGVSGSGVSANSQGLFIFSAVSSSALNQSLNHYTIKATITIDGEARVNFIPMKQQLPVYTLTGAFTINQSQQLVGSFWALSNGDKIESSSRISSGHYRVQDVNGTPVAGLTQSGITPNSDGLFFITPAATTINTESTLYYAHIRINVDGVDIDHVIPLTYSNPEYSVKAQFSINALNQLQATFWVTADNQSRTSGLGAANYTVYDASGTAVSGLTQSGISADSNGRFAITPVSASLLTDLTHYSVKVGIVCDGVERIAYKGFTLLGT